MSWMPKGPGRHRRDTNAVRRKGDETIFTEGAGRIKKVVRRWRVYS